MARVTTERAQEILHASARRGIEHIDEVAKLAADLIDVRAAAVEIANLRTENARLAHLAGQAADLVVERNHYRERATTHRARFDWMQSIAAAAMRLGLAECRRLRARLADAAEEIDRHWSERRAVAARVGCQPGSDLGREVGDMVDAMGALMVELKAACCDRDALRAIVEGRIVPPTDAEIAAHEAAGGGWCVLARWKGDAPAEMGEVRGRRAVRMLRDEGWAVRWWPLDAEDVLCPWPVTP